MERKRLREKARQLQALTEQKKDVWSQQAVENRLSGQGEGKPICHSLGISRPSRGSPNGSANVVLQDVAATMHPGNVSRKYRIRRSPMSGYTLQVGRRPLDNPGDRSCFRVRVLHFEREPEAEGTSCRPRPEGGRDGPMAMRTARPLSCFSLVIYRFESRAATGNVKLAVVGRATDPITQKEVSKTFLLPDAAVQMPDSEFRSALEPIFSDALGWCRKAAGIPSI